MLRKANIARAIQSCQLINHAYGLFEGKEKPTAGITTDDGEFHRVSEMIRLYPDGPLSRKELFAIVTETPTTYRISVRGTDSWPDWVTDARLGLKRTTFGGHCTAGVNDLAMQLFDQLIIPSTKTIVLAGHSLGAAIITRLATLLPRVDEIYPIASPKFADDIFADEYRLEFSARTLRPVNLADDVPFLPKSIPGLLDLYHVCPALEFADDKDDLRTNHALTTYATMLRRFL